jgi:hypothetical protein
MAMVRRDVGIELILIDMYFFFLHEDYRRAVVVSQGKIDYEKKIHGFPLSPVFTGAGCKGMTGLIFMLRGAAKRHDGFYGFIRTIS